MGVPPRKRLLAGRAGARVAWSTRNEISHLIVQVLDPVSDFFRLKADLSEDQTQGPRPGRLESHGFRTGAGPPSCVPR